MKRYLKWLPILALPVLVICGYLHQQVSAQNISHNYTCTTTTISSASSPVAVMTPGQSTMIFMENAAAAAPNTNPVLVWPYTGTTVPAATPSPKGWMEIPSGAWFVDSVRCDSPSCFEAIGQGWAAVLESGSTSTNVSVCTR